MRLILKISLLMSLILQFDLSHGFWSDPVVAAKCEGLQRIEARHERWKAELARLQRERNATLDRDFVVRSVTKALNRLIYIQQESGQESSNLLLVADARRFINQVPTHINKQMSDFVAYNALPTFERRINEALSVANRRYSGICHIVPDEPQDIVAY